MKNLFFSFILVFFLAGCATTTSVPVEVDVPIPVPCKVTSPDKPVFPLQEAKKEEDLFTKIKKALAEIELRKGYETELEAAVKSCQ